MTPDQILIAKRILAMSPPELEDFRENMRLFDLALDRLRGVTGQPTRTERAFNRMSTIHGDIARMSETPYDKFIEHPQVPA